VSRAVIVNPYDIVTPWHHTPPVSDTSSRPGLESFAW